MPTRATLAAATRLTALAVGSGSVTAALVPVAASAWRALVASPAPNPDDAIALLAAVPAAAGSGWVCLTAALTLLTLDWHRAGRRRGRFAASVHAMSPRLVHRFATVALGAGIAVGPAPAALASGPYDPSWVTGTTATVSGHAPNPSAPTTAGTTTAGATAAGTTTADTTTADTTTAGPRHRSPVSSDERVVVRAGDSLWSIAAAHLPPGAAPETVAAAWPDWYRANHVVIGADPDLIVPGQQLSPPD